MAKALYGHVGAQPGTSLATLQLRQRIADLEAEVLRLKKENDELRALALDSLERAANSELLDA